MKRRPSIPLTIDVDTPKTHGVKDWSLETCLENNYKIIARIGRGNFGVVRHARRLSDGEQVALKLVHSKHCELVTLEYALLKSLDHPHIIKCYDRISLANLEQEMLVFEHFDGSSLNQAVSKWRTIEEEKARAIFLALLSAVAYLHSKEIVHRDIKGDNVLVCQDLSDLRLIDFNTSRRMQEGETPFTVTGMHTWSAPEVLMGNSPGRPNDVWGLGLCLHLMVFGQLLCSWEDVAVDAYLARLVKKATALKQSSSHIVSNECMMILKCCLEVDRTARVPAQSLIQNNPFNIVVDK